MIVKEIMNRNVKTIRPEDSVRYAAQIMNENRIGSLVVVSGTGEVVGILTERDILTDVVATGKSADDVKVSEIMTKNIITITPDKTLEEAGDIMTKYKIKKLPVVEGGRLVGIVTASDLVAYEKSLIEKVAVLLAISPMKNIGG
ncbi:MAG: CBS domain-containing protein [Candidatus Aenigmatarchaeota archaeon]